MDLEMVSCGSLDTHELAWAAGFFDGEGSICCSFRAGRAEISFSVSQSDRRPIDRFHKVIKVGSVRGPYAQRYVNGKPYYIYSVSTHSRIQAVVAMLWRWLSEPKREQVTRAIQSILPTLQKSFEYNSRIADLRAEYVKLKCGRKSVPKGVRSYLMSKYGFTNRHTMSSILDNRSHKVKGGGKMKLAIDF